MLVAAYLSLAKTSSDSRRSTEMRQSVHRSKTPSLVGGRVGRPASLDRRPCTVTPESRWRTGSGRAERLSWTCDACSMVVRAAGASLRRLADVAVMQATDFGNLHDPARRGELDGPDVRRILVEREMGARPVIVGEVCVQRRQTCSVGGSPTGATARRPVAWMAGRRETQALKPIDETIGRMGASGRAVT